MQAGPVLQATADNAAFAADDAEATVDATADAAATSDTAIDAIGAAAGDTAVATFRKQLTSCSTMQNYTLPVFQVTFQVQPNTFLDRISLCLKVRPPEDAFRR